MIEVFPAVRKFLATPLFTLSGGVVTAGSLLVGAALFVGSLAAAPLAGRWVRNVLRGRGHSEGAHFAIAKMVSYAVLVTGTFVALQTMGLSLDAVFTASAALLVGIGFGLQNIAQNFVSGVILLIEQPVRHGDYVRVGDVLGRVEDIGLRATTVVTRDEVTIIVPNSNFITSQVVNHSRPTSKLRIAAAVGVAYGTPAQQVVGALLEAVASAEGVLSDPEPEVRLDDFADSSVNYTLLVWIADPREDLRIASRVRIAIEASFAKHAIEIPFPQRVVHTRAA